MKTCGTCKKKVEKLARQAPPACAKCYMRERRGTDPDQRDKAPPGEGTAVTIRCLVTEEEAWEKAAKKAGKKLRPWIRDTLNAKT